MFFALLSFINIKVDKSQISHNKSFWDYFINFNTSTILFEARPSP